MSKNIIRYGLMAGSALVIYFMVFYYVEPKLMLGLGVYYSSSIFTIVAMILAGIQVRKSNEGQLKYRDALRVVFGVWVIASAFYWFFYWYMFNLHPDLIDIQREMALEGLERMKETTSQLSGSKYEMAKRQILEEDMSVGLKEAAQGWVFSIIFGFLLSLLVALFVRREYKLPS